MYSEIVLREMKHRERGSTNKLRNTTQWVLHRFIFSPHLSINRIPVSADEDVNKALVYGWVADIHAHQRALVTSQIPVTTMPLRRPKMFI